MATLADNNKLVLLIEKDLVHFKAMMRSFLLLILCALSIVVSQNAYAQQEKKVPPKQAVDTEAVRVPKVDFSTLRLSKTNKVDKIIDGLTVLLKDGTIVRLASVYTPDFHIWDDAVYAQKAFQYLQKALPENTDVQFYQSKNKKWGQENRMGHKLGHLVIKQDQQWVQGALLARGLAFVKTIPKSTDLLSEMSLIEDKARNKNLGMWAKDSPYRILTVEETSNRIGDYAIIEGVVQKVAVVRNTIYLNFGSNWKTDFTIMIPSSLRRDFAKENIQLMSLANKSIRVRGNLRKYNGPLIELDNTANLQIIKETNTE